MDKSPCLPSMSQPLVHIPHQGAIKGYLDSTQQVARFLNIPFATVHQRWQKASRPDPWEGVRDGTKMGPMCPQLIPESGNIRTAVFGVPAGPGFQVSERDCLNLNLHIPSQALLEQQSGGGHPLVSPLPVVCYVHGGRFRSGGNAMPEYDFTNFVQRSVEMGKPVIVAVINYRLGHLGFLASEELIQAEEKRLVDLYGPGGESRVEESFGNWGFDDQKMGLEWIRDHIHTFGGDPQQVTAMGHSAGSNAIAYHMMLPSHHGLFQRAILQSGCTNVLRTQLAENEGQRRFDHLCNQFEIPDYPQDPASKVDQLRSICPLKLVQAPDVADSDNMTHPFRYSPRYHPHHPQQDTTAPLLFSEDSFHMSIRPENYDPGLISVIIGRNADESAIFAGTTGANSIKTFYPMLDRFVAPIYHQTMMNLYGHPQTDKEAKRIAIHFTNDKQFRFAEHLTCQALLGLERPSSNPRDQRRRQRQLWKNGSPPPKRTPRAVNRYLFHSSLEIIRQKCPGLGSHHSAEMAFTVMSDVFQKLMTEKEKVFGWGMCSKWIDFMWGDDEVLTPRERQGKETFVITEDLEVRKGPFEVLERKYIDFQMMNEDWFAQQTKSRVGGSLIRRGARKEEGGYEEILARL